MYLHKNENYSQYINDLIDQDRRTKLDPGYLAQRRQALKAELADLDKSEKQGAAASDGSAYKALVAEARAWENTDNPQIRYFNSEEHRQYEEVKRRYYPRLKTLPEGRGATMDVIKKFIKDFEAE